MRFSIVPWAACATRALAGYPGHGGRITGDEHVRHRYLRGTSASQSPLR